MVLTGRECAATTRRMKEMKIDYICQNIKDKYKYLINFIAENNFSKEQIAYIGDDLNDFYPMSLAGYVGCPYDAYDEIKEISNYVSQKKGGAGAVRDFVEHILKERGEWKYAFYKAYDIPSDYKEV